MSAEDVQLYESHPQRGKDLLSQIPCVPEEVIVATAQHHENLAGRGFPYHLPRLKIHPFARIIAVADEFCHLALKGPIGSRLHPHEAVVHIMETRENEFDMVFVRALMEICKFPIPDKLKNIRMFMDTELK